MLTPPGPDADQLRQIISSALRVPDHGKLEPWRIISLPIAGRAQLTEWLLTRHRAIDAGVSDAALDKDRERFGRSPVILVVVASIASTDRIPEQEQLLSGGCVCFALLLAAQALGFGAQWLTGWAAYDRGVAAQLGMADHERVLGFIHVGSAAEPAPERLRPTLDAKFSEYAPR